LTLYTDTSYFLIVADIVQWAHEHGIPTGPGRGSNPSSIAAYALGITGIDPIRFNLLFERFINPDRPPDLPNFDIDVSPKGRKRVVTYVTKKYGRNRTGRIAVFKSFSTKRAIREAAAVLNIRSDKLNRIIKLIPHDCYNTTLSLVLKDVPRLAELEKEPRYKEIFDIVQKIEGKVRRVSLYPDGFIISKTAIDEYVPLYRDPSTGTIASQFTVDQIWQYGATGFRFLGLKCLDAIKNTEELIRKRGVPYAGFSIDTIPLDDKLTFTMLGKGNMAGVFQCKSNKMREIFRKAKPDCIPDLAALNAFCHHCFRDLVTLNVLCHPGLNDYIPLFIDCKHGRQPVALDPCLEDILKETCGIILFQEQVMQMIQLITGCTLAQSDTIRRIMAQQGYKKIRIEEKRFILNVARRGFTEQNAEYLFDMLTEFAKYSSSKSHAVSYALLTYQTAYLKVHFPKEYCGKDI
jgi:DNA polymerase-3 subunit alpha